ncbi:MAG: coproporphyrinogen dehydrogenase HemZ [Clostridia bacterium]|nr:coproporphyrinogen dehydrogenase HemZ [Clostridia bacterium]
MVIKTIGHSAEDGVRQIMQLFFDINSDITVISEFNCIGESCTSKATVFVGGQEAQGEFSCIKQIKIERERTDIIKKAVFRACKRLSNMPTPWGVSTGIRPAKTARMLLDENAADDEILSFMREELWVSDEKARLSLAVAKQEKKILDNRLNDGVSLYIGVPFCPTRCAYCSFISQATKHNEKYIEPYVSALLLEIEAVGKLAEEYGFKAETIYFGGGTPTVLSPSALDRVIKQVKKCFDISKLREFTVEAGRPDTFSEEMLDMLYENKVQRISINPQTMNQKTLDLIGRKHTTEETIQAFEMAKKYNFSINADLIAGLPEETVKDFEYTLNELLKLSPDAVTVHTMYLKRAARLIDDFEKYRFTSQGASMMQYANEKLTECGFNPYYMYKQRNTLGNLENVAFCRENHECLYNIYIMEEIHTVLAMGGGASTKMVKGDKIERIFNPKDACDYIKRIDEIIEKKREGLKFLK